MPASFVVEASEGADGTDDGIGGGNHASGLLHNLGKDVASFRGALLKEAKGMAVTVNGQSVVEVEFVGDTGRRLPMEDCLFYGVTFGVIADRAARFMADEA
ncbi:MAG TPA: hypothetical protein VJR26_09155 [Candidatus Acidoferrales bacterium]|nr:hypothetical protein [Candidatus Acidoferrales bacterium]